ncbi:hypothetical protein GCM10010344_77410 [Streptomyces bluensis]|nr:hypothetical protein GCM10010344_77410 [Streptomyces bluensis]
MLSRLDLVVTDRLHGMVLALRTGAPALVVDPVEGGAKVTAQARACGWPALVPAERLDEPVLDRWWEWCTTSGRGLAREIGAGFREGAAADGTEDLLQALRPGATVRQRPGRGPAQPVYRRAVDRRWGPSRSRSRDSISLGSTRRSRSTHGSAAAAPAKARREAESRGTVRARCTVRRSAGTAGRRSQVNHSVLRMPWARRSVASLATDG